MGKGKGAVGGKGLGKGVGRMKRHRKVMKDAVRGIGEIPRFFLGW